MSLICHMMPHCADPGLESLSAVAFLFLLMTLFILAIPCLLVLCRRFDSPILRYPIVRRWRGEPEERDVIYRPEPRRFYGPEHRRVYRVEPHRGYRAESPDAYEMEDPPIYEDERE